MVAVLLALSTRALVPPTPLGRDAPADRFSEGRARDGIAALAQDIGRRVNGTAGYRKAVAYLSAELGKIPGVEVQVQEGSGTNFHRFAPWIPFVFRTTNVLGRLPGRSSDAILLDAHFDTLTDSDGAADDAAGVACVVEVLRILAREAPLDRTIIVNLNGGEERGGLGALAFLDPAHRHRAAWHRRRAGQRSRDRRRPKAVAPLDHHARARLPGEPLVNLSVRRTQAQRLRATFR